MIQIRQAGVKGLGVFAAERIKPGSRILSEQPLLLITQRKEIYKATKQLSSQDRTRLKELSISPIRRSSVLSWTEATWHALSATASEAFRPKIQKSISSLPSWGDVAEHLSILDIFRNNNFDIGNGTQAVFHQISRLNHSCVPNAQGNFNAAIGRFTIHAIRPIDPGEEVTLSYLIEFGALRDARRSRLQDGYGFLCDCPACVPGSKTSQLSEQRRMAAQLKLHEYAERSANLVSPDVGAELEMMETLIAMYEAEGVLGRELATMYLTAAELSSKLQNWDKSVDLCTRALYIERIVVGEDSPLYLESVARMQRAKLLD